MAQKYIKQLSNCGGVVNRATAKARAQSALIRYPNLVGEIHLLSYFWAKSLFWKMENKKRRKTLSVADIPDSARKDIEYLFLLFYLFINF